MIQIYVENKLEVGVCPLFPPENQQQDKPIESYVLLVWMRVRIPPTPLIKKEKTLGFLFFGF
jgi:hypothetical protein